MLKAFMPLLFLGLSLTTTVAHAQTTFRRSAQAPLTVEVSALLMSPQYAHIVNGLMVQARQSGRLVSLTGYQVTQLGQQRYVSVQVSTRIAASIGSPWIPTGEIIAQIAFGPMGEVGVDGVFFKPAATGPGGISVGNN